MMPTVVVIVSRVSNRDRLSRIGASVAELKDLPGVVNKVDTVQRFHGSF
jgi:hypothetical protein